MAGFAVASAALVGLPGCAAQGFTGARLLPSLPAPAATARVASTSGATARETGAAAHELPAPSGSPLVSPRGMAGAPSAAAVPETGLDATLDSVVRRYYDAVDRLPADMDPQPLAVLFVPGCPCRAQLRAVRRARVRGEHYVDQVRINALVPSRDGPATADVLADVRASRGGLVTSSGRRVTSVPAKAHVRRLFRLVHRRRGWRIAAIEAV